MKSFIVPTASRPLFLLTILIPIASVSCLAQKSKMDKPNIIFILTDDLGFGDVGVFFQKQREKANDKSEPWMFTPHLDALAASGASLPDHYCAAPVCAPARASILLGVSQGHANVRDNQFDKALEDNHTMATVLREAGYATAAIGKYGLQGDKRWDENGEEWPAHPLNRGFDYFLGYIRHVDGHEHYPKEGLYRKPKEVWENRTEISQKLDKCFTTDLWIAAAKKWIVQNNREKKKPFFMYLAFDTPHAVLELPTQGYPRGGGLKGGIQWLDKPGQMITTASGKPDSWIHPDYAKATYDDDNNASTPAVPWPDTYKRYATSVRRIDSSVGDLVRLLKDLDLYSNTLIVFTSDNGPSLESYLPESYVPNNPDFFNSFGPFDGTKRDCWEGGVRMPTMASWPSRIPAGRVLDNASASYDWLPTFAAAAGVPVPARCDGVSLLPSLTGSGPQREGLVYVEYFNNGTTPELPEFHPDHRGRKRRQMQLIRIGDYTGVRYDVQSHDDRFEIYDVVKDPSQSRNLAQDGAMDSLQHVMLDRVLQVRRPNSTAPRPYDNAPIPSVTKQQTGNGLTWQVYKGAFPWVPAVAGMNPTARGGASRPEAGAFDLKGEGAVLFEGFINVDKEGKYTFHIDAPSGALLRLHDATVLDVQVGAPASTGTVLLTAGLHPFRLYCLQRSEPKFELDLQWEGPGFTRQEIPASVYRR
jgi:arylsulfatase A-like enzyme